MVPRFSPDASNGEGCLALALLVAITIVVMFVIGINAAPENKAAQKIPTNELAN